MIGNIEIEEGEEEEEEEDEKGRARAIGKSKFSVGPIWNETNYIGNLLACLGYQLLY